MSQPIDKILSEFEYLELGLVPFSSRLKTWDNDDLPHTGNPSNLLAQLPEKEARIAKRRFRKIFKQLRRQIERETTDLLTRAGWQRRYSSECTSRGPQFYSRYSRFNHRIPDRLKRVQFVDERLRSFDIQWGKKGDSPSPPQLISREWFVYSALRMLRKQKANPDRQRGLLI